MRRAGRSVYLAVGRNWWIPRPKAPLRNSGQRMATIDGLRCRRRRTARPSQFAAGSVNVLPVHARVAVEADQPHTDPILARAPEWARVAAGAAIGCVVEGVGADPATVRQPLRGAHLSRRRGLTRWSGWPIGSCGSYGTVGSRHLSLSWHCARRARCCTSRMLC